MKPRPEVCAVLQLSAVMMLVKLVQGQGNTQNGQQEPQQQQEYNYNSNYNSYNYYETSDDEGSPYQHICYSCQYSVLKAHPSGPAGCRDPFDADSIPYVTCSSPCQKLYHKIGDSDYIVSRSCAPNCKELRDHDKYVECCSERLCNATTRLHLPWSTVSFSVLLVIILQHYVSR